MKKSSQRCYFYLCSILILRVNHVMSAGGSSEGTEKTASSKVLPIILMKESDILEIPNDVSLAPVFVYWEKMEFHADKGLYERYFCGIDTEKKRKKVKNAREKSKEENIMKPSISDNCLFEKSRLYLSTIFGKTPRCPEEPEPLISKIFHVERKIIDPADEVILNFKWSSCGVAGKNKLYRFGYQIWLKSGTLDKRKSLKPPLTRSMAVPDKDIIDYEIYRFCYDHTTQEVLYTKHRILSPVLLSNEQLKEDPEKTYPISNLKYDNVELDFQNIEKMRNQTNGIGTSNVSTSDKDSKIIQSDLNLHDYQIEQLVPTEDFAFILWKKPTFHVVNGKRMHKELVKPWKEINKIIQSRASIGLEYDIYTGTFDISIEENENKSSKTEDETRIPQIWIKIVLHQFSKPEDKIDINEGIAMIVNNHMNDDLEKKIISEYCGNEYTSEYPPKKKTNFPEPEQFTYIRSCLVTKKIQNLFGLNLYIRDVIYFF